MTSSNTEVKRRILKPRWERILPALIEVLTRGESVESRQFARDELRRMATLADAHVAERKRATQFELQRGEPS